MKVSRGVIAAVILTFAVPVGAQSLGELAKKEQERRKTAAPAKKVYTNDDLKKIEPPPGGVTPADPAKPGDPAAKPADAAKTGDAAKTDDKPAAGEAEWRARMNLARDTVRRSELFRDSLQSRINGLTADFTARDDPFQRAQIADARQKALDELAQVNKDIESGKKAITDIEEEARRASVPPGWIR
jgi:hypothetical protein